MNGERIQRKISLPLITTPTRATKRVHSSISGQLDYANCERGTWLKKFVRIENDAITLCNSKNDRSGIEIIEMQSALVSLKDKTTFCVNTPNGTHAFRTGTEAKAMKWLIVISQYCYLQPWREGYCEKLSGRKNIFEKRFLRLSSCGEISWYKSDKDSDQRGSFKITSAHKVAIDETLSKTVLLHSGERENGRVYEFKFEDKMEALSWKQAMEWYTRLRPRRYSVLSR